MKKRPPTQSATGPQRTPKSAADFTTLEESLEKLKRSPRFDFVRSLQIAELLGADHQAKSLKGITIEELVALGASKIVKRRSISPQSLALMSSIFNNLAGEADTYIDSGEPSPEVTLGLPSYDEMVTKLFPRLSEDAAPHFRSSEAELRLLALVERIRRSPNRARVEALKIADLWPSDGPSAPFEEAMTVRQILEIDLEVIFKKRSFSNAKLRALTAAFESAMSQLENKIETPTQSPSVEISSTTPTLEVDVSNLPWVVGSAVKKLIETLLSSTALSKADVSLILERLGAVQIGTLWAVEEYGAATAAALLNKAEPVIAEATADAARTLAGLVLDDSMSGLTPWRHMLIAPAIPTDTFLVVLGIRPADLAVVRGFAQALLRALRATHPVVGGHSLLGYWTFHPDLLEMTLRGMLSSERGRDDALATFQHLLPALTSEERSNLLDLISLAR